MSIGRRPSFLSLFASLAEVVVLPAPLSPTMRMRAGGLRSSGAWSPPSRVVSSSWKILTICSPGLIDLRTFSPSACSLTLAMNSLATENSTSASSSARRISRSASVMFFSEILPCPRSFLNTPSRLSESELNMMVDGYVLMDVGVGSVDLLVKVCYGSAGAVFGVYAASLSMTNVHCRAGW